MGGVTTGGGVMMGGNVILDVLKSANNCANDLPFSS